MSCPHCGHTYLQVKTTAIAPPVKSHSVCVRGRLLDTNHSFTLDYRDVSAEAAVEAAKRDARHIFGTDTDAKVIIDQIYVSN